MTEITPGVVCLPIVFVNVYFVSEPNGSWVLVDTGVPGSAKKIVDAAADRFGTAVKPSAIVLTHGHIDHSGSCKELAELWDVPVYAHPLEMPYLTGKSPYPPPDPTIGGAIGFMSRFIPASAPDLGSRVQSLEPDGAITIMPGWEWHHTPGHAPGNISLFRPHDRTLIAGDALATVDMSPWIALATKPQKLCAAGPPFTTNWSAARASVQKLSEMEPATVACGHGEPMSGPGLAEDLRRFAAGFTPPSRGRYVPNPAVTDEQGIVSVPPPVPDPLPTIAAGVGAAAISGLTTAILVRNRRR